MLGMHSLEDKTVEQQDYPIPFHDDFPLFSLFKCTRLFRAFLIFGPSGFRSVFGLTPADTHLLREILVYQKATCLHIGRSSFFNLCRKFICGPP